MTHEELKEKILAAIAVRGCQDEECADPANEEGGCLCLMHAESVLSAIEQSGCTICPNEPTEEMVKVASTELNGWDRRFDGASTISWNAYIAMLSSSPFNTQGDEDETN